MFKKIISVLVLVLMLTASVTGVMAADADTSSEDFIVKSASFDEEEGVVNVVITNTTDKDMYVSRLVFLFQDEANLFTIESDNFEDSAIMFQKLEIEALSDFEISLDASVTSVPDGKKVGIDLMAAYETVEQKFDFTNTEDAVKTVEYKDIVNEFGKNDGEITKAQAVMNFIKQTGFSMTSWQQIVMLLIACVLLYLAIVKGFEPLLLLPIAFGMLLTNLAGAEMFHEELFAGGHVHWDMFGGKGNITPGLIDYLYLGVKLGIYPCLIFVGVGAMTDFGPLIANPKSLLLGAAAQVGIFATYLGAIALGFLPKEAASIGIIGGADGPTAIFVTSKLAPHLLGPIAVAAYSYMALVPVIQPPIMKLLTTKEERCIEMKALRQVSKTEKIIFPIVVTIFVALLVPSAGALVGCLMLGNLLTESGVCERLSKTVQNELMNIVTVFLGISVGATATASTFLSLETIKIIVMGVVAFGVATACGVLLAKFMNLFLKNKINPLIGSAGVSAVPMAARVSQTVGQKENPSNFLLMHAMGPNVAGVIGSAIAAGALIALLG